MDAGTCAAVWIIGRLVLFILIGLAVWLLACVWRKRE